MRALIPLLLILPAVAHADCAGATLISCNVGGGDALEVCINDGAFTYAFGPPGAPELQLSVPMADGTVTPWPGVGSYIWSAVAFQNGDVIYEAWTSAERTPDTPEMTAGVNVLQGEGVLAQITCESGEIAPAFALSDAMAVNGFCWDHESQVWLQGSCS